MSPFFSLPQRWRTAVEMWFSEESPRGLRGKFESSVCGLSGRGCRCCESTRRFTVERDVYKEKSLSRPQNPSPSFRSEHGYRSKKPPSCCHGCMLYARFRMRLVAPCRGWMPRLLAPEAFAPDRMCCCSNACWGDIAKNVQHENMLPDSVPGKILLFVHMVLNVCCFESSAGTQPI